MILKLGFLSTGRVAHLMTTLANFKFALYIPDIAVGVYEHHDGPDGAAGLEKEDPAAVEEEEDGEAELDRVAGGLDMIEIIIRMIVSDQM